MAANTNANLVLSMFAFYITIIVLLGLIGSSVVQAQGFSTPPEPSTFTFLSQISYFFQGIGFVLSDLPAWANTLLFLPLGITLFYIGLSFIRGSS